MSAAELLDTFGKVFSKSLSSGSSSVASSSPFEPVKAPSTPIVQPPIPDLSRPPPSLSIPLPPTKPSNVTPPPSPYIPMPPRSDSQTPYTPTKPLYQPPPYTPDSSTKSPYCPPLPPPPPPPPPPSTTTTTAVESLSFPPFNSRASSTWVPPPPPPPPPPELVESEISPSGGDYDSGSRNYGQSWSDYDEESDDRNWGEPPGNEELEALNSDTPSSPPPYEKGFTGSLAPPPLPPAFCAPRSNLRELVSEDHRTNLVSIQPNTNDSDYRCYNYHSLSEEPKPVPAPIPSIRSLFSAGMDQDLRVKKPSLKQGRRESGSDMDISNSDSEDNNMDISDESVKEGTNSKNDVTRLKDTNTTGNENDVTAENKDIERAEKNDSESDADAVDSDKDSKTSKQGDSSPLRDEHEKDGEPITSIVGNSGNMTPSDEEDDAERVMAINAKEVESILSQMRKASSLNSVSENNIGSNSCASISSNVKVLTNSDADVDGSQCMIGDKRSESEVNANEDNSSVFVNQISEKSNNGPTQNENGDGSDEKSDGKEVYIPTVIAKTGERANTEKDFSAPRSVTEGNMIDVIDVMKNLDREFNQQKTRVPRGGPSPRFVNRGRGLLQFGGMGRGERFVSPHRGAWSFGGPVFNSPRGRGRIHRGTPPYTPPPRGFRGPNPNRGRTWYGTENWF